MSRPAKFLTAPEVAEILRVGTWQVVNLCRDGKIPATKPGKSWLIAESDLNAYLEKHSNQRASA